MKMSKAMTTAMRRDERELLDEIRQAFGAAYQGRKDPTKAANELIEKLFAQLGCMGPAMAEQAGKEGEAKGRTAGAAARKAIEDEKTELEGKLAAARERIAELEHAAGAAQPQAEPAAE